MSNLLSSEPVKESGSYKCTAKGHVDDCRRSGRDVTALMEVEAMFHASTRSAAGLPRISCKISHQGIKYHVEQQTADRGRHNKAEHMPLVRTLIDSANLVGHQTGYQTDTQLQQESFRRVHHIDGVKQIPMVIPRAPPNPRKSLPISGLPGRRPHCPDEWRWRLLREG